MVVQAQQASVSMLQRRFRIGYNRAARIIDMMEERQIIGPADGSRPRQVLISEADLQNMKESTEDYRTMESYIETFRMPEEFQRFRGDRRDLGTLRHEYDR